MMRNVVFAALLAVYPAAAGAQSGLEERIDAGAQEFQSSCAACHGVDGRGDGPLTPVLTARPADLTQLSAQNGGAFPFGRVYDVIDGREIVGAHGSREMPIWGNVYNSDAENIYGDLAGTAGAEVYAAAKILFLLDYLSSIQE